MLRQGLRDLLDATPGKEPYDPQPNLPGETVAEGNTVELNYDLDYICCTLFPELREEYEWNAIVQQAYDEVKAKGTASTSSEFQDEVKKNLQNKGYRVGTGGKIVPTPGLVQVAGLPKEPGSVYVKPNSNPFIIQSKRVHEESHVAWMRDQKLYGTLLSLRVLLAEDKEAEEKAQADLEKFIKRLSGPEALYETEKRAYEDQRKHMEKMLRDIFKICKKENKLPGSPRLP